MTQKKSKALDIELSLSENEDSKTQAGAGSTIGAAALIDTFFKGMEKVFQNILSSNKGVFFDFKAHSKTKKNWKTVQFGLKRPLSQVNIVTSFW